MYLLLISVVDDCMRKLHLSLFAPSSLPITFLSHTLKSPLLQGQVHSLFVIRSLATIALV